MEFRSFLLYSQSLILSFSLTLSLLLSLALARSRSLSLALALSLSLTHSLSLSLSLSLTHTHTHLARPFPLHLSARLSVYGEHISSRTHSMHNTPAVCLFVCPCMPQHMTSTHSIFPYKRTHSIYSVCTSVHLSADTGVHQIINCDDVLIVVRARAKPKHVCKYIHSAT